MRTGRRGSLVVLSLALAGGGPLGAQRAELPHGLQAGRRDVGMRALPRPGEPLTVWYPASCGPRPSASATPCRDAVPDSGRFPLLVFAPAEGNAVQDAVLARYFASHGYAVVVVPAGVAADLETALHAALAFPFVDSTQVVAAGAGVGAAAARRLAVRGKTIDALAELRPVDDPPEAAGRSIATLIVRDPTDRPAAAVDGRITVSLPGGPSDHVRLVIAVTHAFLNAALGRGSLSLTDLTRRLRAAGLAACCPADYRR